MGTGLYRVPLAVAVRNGFQVIEQLPLKQSEPDPGLGGDPSPGDILITLRAELSLTGFPRSCLAPGLAWPSLSEERPHVGLWWWSLLEPARALEAARVS